MRATLKPAIAAICLAVSVLLSARAAGAGMPMPSKSDFTSKAYSYRTDSPEPEMQSLVASGMPAARRGEGLANKVSWKEFVSLPSLRPSFFDAVRKCHPKLGRLNKCKGKQELELKLAESYSMSVSVTNSSTGESANGCYAIKQDDKKGTVLTFSFPQPGTYKVTFFPHRPGASKSTSCGEFLVRRE